MKKSSSNHVFLVIFALLFSSLSWGQTTFSWNFGTSSGSASTSSGSLADLTVGNISIGNTLGTVTMLSTTSASSGYTGASGQYNAGNASRTGALNTGSSGSAYFEFTLTPSTGYKVNLSSISFGTRSTSTAPQAYTLRSSLDSYASDIATGTISNTSTWALKSNTGLTFQGTSGTAVTFRLYGYNGTGSPSSGTINWRIDDLSIVVSLTAESGSNPLITVDPGTLDNFKYVYNSGPSTQQSFTVSGEDLTSDITLTPPTNFEISTQSGPLFSATNPIVLTQDAGIVEETTIYVRLKSGLDIDEYSENITATSDDATDKTVTCNGKVIADEPTNYPTGFSATVNSYNQITVNWTDASSGQLPSAYLVKASTMPAVPAPSDGTEEADAALVKNISQGTQQAVFTGLDPETTYNFAIWPYTNSGTDINYKTGSQPYAQGTTTAAPVAMTPMHTGTIATFTDWTHNTVVQGAVSGDDYMQLKDSTSSLISPAYNGNGYTGEQLTFKARTFGGNNVAENTIYVAVSTDNGANWTDITSILPASSTLNDITPIDLSSYTGTQIKIKIYMQGTNTSIGAGIDNVLLSGYVVTDATYNTIAIDGNNSGWNAGEVFPNVTAADNAHFTWDEDYLYFAIADAEADYDNVATYLFINTAPEYYEYTTDNVYGWVNYFKLPFKANWVFVWKNNPGDDYMEIRQWNAGTQNWDQIGAVNTNSVELTPFALPGLYVEFAIGSNYRECRLPRALLGATSNTAKIKVASVTEQQYDSYWRYFGWPSQGWTDGARTANQTLTHAYEYTLDEYIYPNQAQYLKKDIFLTGNTTISADDEFDNFVVEPDVNLTLNAGTTLDVNGDFIIKSDTGSTGSFIDNGTLNITGNVIVQSYLADQTNTGWYVSSPLSSAKGDVFNGSYAVYAYDSENAGWDAVGSGDNLEPVRGYVTKFGTGTGVNDKTVEFTGAGNTLNTGTKTSSTLYRTGFGGGNYGWNLVGNPYPSAIDWDASSGVTKTNLNNATYIRKANGTVATYNGTGVNGGSRYIAPGQAFWVQVAGSIGTPTGTGTLSFTNDARVHMDINLLKSTNEDGLRLTLSRNNLTDEMVIRFKNSASDGFDPMFDAVKMFSENNDIPQIYSVLNNDEQMAINSYSDLLTDKSVVVAIQTNVAGNHSITAGDLSAFDSQVSVLLEDTYTNSIIDLRQQNSYTFNTAVTSDDNRFVVHFVLGTTSDNSLNNSGINTTHIYTFDKAVYITNIVSDDATAVIYNLLGQEVLSQKLQASALNKLNAGLVSGQYIVKVVDNSNVVSQKVFIK